MLLSEPLHLLVDRGIQEKSQDRRRRAVDGHRDGGIGITQVKAVVEGLHIVQGSDGNAGIADLAVDIRPFIRVKSVQGHRIECRRQAFGLGMFRQFPEAPVGPERVSLSGKHASRVLILPLERKYTGGIGEIAGQVFPHQPAQQFPVIRITGQHDPGHHRAGKRGVRGLRPEIPVPHPCDVLISLVLLPDGGPPVEQIPGIRVQCLLFLCGQFLQRCTGSRISPIAAGLQHRRTGLQLLPLPCNVRLLPCVFMVFPDGGSYLSQVPLPLRRNDDGTLGGRFIFQTGQDAFEFRQSLCPEDR